MKNLPILLLFVAVTAASAQSEKFGNYHLDQEYKINATGTLRLKASDAKVIITGSARATAHVKIDREVNVKGLTFGEQEFRVDISEESGNLSIREYKRGSVSGIVGYHSEKYTITIDVPDGISLNINGDDGDYIIKSVNGAIELDADDADIELLGCKGNFFHIKLDDGDLRMDMGQGELKVDADDADIHIKNASFEKIAVEIDDGDFIVETTLVENGNYFISAQDGLVAMKVLGGGGKFEIRHDDSSIHAGTGFEFVERSENRTRVATSTGSARVEIRADDARVRLTR
ncbi:MAG: DUF4097 family beta strand repeat protein [Cyclobacteriaceae bacterium]|nr:DUF4097 family beta strand repeat protein [Cyclobacteriaceae bacterium]